MSEHSIKALVSADSTDAMRLSIAAGWNQTECDWRRVASLAPTSCWGLWLNDRLVSSTAAICYGDELAWVGMVLTDPAYQGRGLARKLMNHCLEYLHDRRIRCIRLDATDAGKPLYRSLGFRDEYQVERWRRPAAPVPKPGPSLETFRLEPELDRTAFGADRSRLLGELSHIESASCAGAGYAMGRSGNLARYFGPCVSTSAAVARRLLLWFLTRHADGPVFWDLIPHNESARALAQELGFERQRALTRMIWQGTTTSAPDDCPRMVYALAGFEFG